MNDSQAPLADGRKRRAILLTIAAGTFVSVLDQTGVTLGLPQMALEFGATIPLVQWVALGYMLTTGFLLLPVGRLFRTIQLLPVEEPALSLSKGPEGEPALNAGDGGAQGAGMGQE